MKVGDLVRISKDTLYVYEGTVGIVINKIWNRVDPTLVLWEVQYECEDWGTRRRRFFSHDIEVINESR